MKKLKKILQSKYFWGLLIFCAVFSFVRVNFKKEEAKSKVYVGKIVSYQKQEQSSTWILKSKKEKIKIVCNCQERKIKEGQIIQVRGTVEQGAKNTIPNTFSYYQYLKNEEIIGQMTTEDIRILKEPSFFDQIKGYLRTFLDTKENSTYLKRILLGVKENENQTIETVYQKNGISHLFAISGMHLSFLYLLGTHLFKKHKEIKSFGLISVYYFMLEKSISCKRAYHFFFLKEINRWFQLELSTKQIYWLNFLIQLIGAPRSIFQIGFQYSFLISFAFLYFGRKRKKYTKIYHCILAFLFSLPITASQNYAINPYSIFNNLFLAPIFFMLIVPFLLGSIIIQPLEEVASKFISCFEWLNQKLAVLPGSSIVLPKIPTIGYIGWLLIVILIYTTKKKRYWFLLIITVLLWKSSPKLDPHAYVHFLDVQEGDAAILIAPRQKEVIMIDTGKESQTLYNKINTFLKSLGITKINLLLLSHGDNDHAGNALAILKDYQVENIMLNEGEDSSIEKMIREKYEKKRVKEYQSSFLFQKYSHVKRNEENDNSIIVRICLYKVCTLFLGDASTKVEEEIIQKNQISATILKVAHHGSNTSTSDKLLKQVHPQYAIISVGKTNHYHHPSESVLNRLEKEKVKVFQTSLYGTITYQITKKGYTIFLNSP